MSLFIRSINRMIFAYLAAVFRIRIRSDPYHLAGSASENVDLDPGTKKKIVINSHTNQPKL